MWRRQSQAKYATIAAVARRGDTADISPSGPRSGRTGSPGGSPASRGSALSEVIVTDDEQRSIESTGEPRASAVSFITTEHFTLQGARSATIAESTGRASMCLASVSGGL